MRNSIVCLFVLCFSLILGAEEPAWRQQLAQYGHSTTWKAAQERRPAITPEALDQAIEAASLYMMNEQYSAGNFRYAYDFTSNLEEEKDNQVRQAGALWSICNLNRDRFTENTRRSALLGLDFFLHNQRGLPDTDLVVVTYKAEKNIKTGTVALFCLALTDFLTGQERYLSAAQQEPFQTALANNLKFLKYQELPNGSWREDYELGGMRLPDEFAPASPYFDGEALLAYLFAEKYYRAHPELTPPIPLKERILDALPKLLRRYTVECFAPGGDTDFTKGFFQWGAMSCGMASTLFADEATQALCLDGVLALAWWQLYDHRLDVRNGNTGYAIEGLIPAYALAQKAGREQEASLLREAIVNTLSRLMTWQVGGPFEGFNPFLVSWKSKMPDRAYGGITSMADSGYIRIDIVQHQLHAMLMARKYLYPDL